MKELIGYLHPTLIDSYLQARIDPGMLCTYQPDRYFAAIATAGHIMRQNRLNPAQAQPLSETDFPAPKSGDTFRRLLIGMINQSALTFNNSPKSDLPPRETKAYESTCLRSDVLFGQAVVNLSSFVGERQPTAYGVRIISQAGQPLFIHKVEGERNSKVALSLQPITLEGITYPPGAIMGVHVRRDCKETGRFEPYVGFGEVEEVDAGEIVAVDFLRPSLFMGTPYERVSRLGDVARRSIYSSQFSEAMKILADYTISDLAAVASKAISAR